MGNTIQARLDQRTQKRLAALVRAYGWTPSHVVREGIRLLEQTRLRGKKRAIIGLGKFDSGVRDLATNKKHLEGYGR